MYYLVTIILEISENNLQDGHDSSVRLDDSLYMVENQNLGKHEKKI